VWEKRLRAKKLRPLLLKHIKKESIKGRKSPGKVIQDSGTMGRGRPSPVLSGTSDGVKNRTTSTPEKKDGNTYRRGGQTTSTDPAVKRKT